MSLGRAISSVAVKFSPAKFIGSTSLPIIAFRNSSREIWLRMAPGGNGGNPRSGSPPDNPSLVVGLFFLVRKSGELAYPSRRAVEERL